VTSVYRFRRWLVGVSSSLRLHGFNNLTSSLSFNIYDICYAKTEEQRAAYIDYIDELYNAERLTQILKDVTNIIGAHANRTRPRPATGNRGGPPG